MGDASNNLTFAGNFGSLKMKIGDKIVEYEALQFHFHAPAEHTINSVRYDAEMHIVFQTKADLEDIKVVTTENG